jgi:hypothetical protein
VSDINKGILIVLIISMIPVFVFAYFAHNMIVHYDDPAELRTDINWDCKKLSDALIDQSYLKYSVYGHPPKGSIDAIHKKQMELNC